jgi:DNA processing protein
MPNDWSKIESDFSAELLCLTPGIGPRLRRQLLDQFGTATAVFQAAPSALREVPGIGPKLCSALLKIQQRDLATDCQQWREQGVKLLVEGSPAYPAALAEIADPPGLLFQRGELLPSDQLAIAIVGTRHCTSYGKQMAERLATGLARNGFTIVSGLARGIDAAAHEAALQCGGRTIGVLGGGVCKIYPAEHNDLAERVIKQGALLSETEPNDDPVKGAFPQRNRIISGLSHGVLVIEASLTSGSLITARLALEQGREVFAVPGRADQEGSRGCHRLIRDGAKLVESIDDILEELGPLMKPTETITGQVIQHPAELQLNEIERAVFAQIAVEATSIDMIMAQAGLPPGQVLATISVLEMKKLIRRVSGQLVQRR